MAASGDLAGATVSSKGESDTRIGRIAAVDAARGWAIVAMIVFHFVRDLEMFGLVRPGTTLTGGWALFARVVAASFLFLSGISLVLAHGRGIRWRSFLRRAGVLALAAAAVSAGTYAFMPERFVYFGILHMILVASLAGLVLMPCRAWISLTAGAGVLVIWAIAGRTLKIDPWFGWTGLAATPRPALDLIPIVPWTAFAFLGIAVGKMVDFDSWARPIHGGPGLVVWLGRNSLVIYILHQPAMIGVMWLLFR